MAFVVLQHLSPDFKSLMDELLSRRTSIRSTGRPPPLPRAEHGAPAAPMKEMIVRGRRLLLNDAIRGTG